MAVICELDCGWLIDHQQAIDRVYYETYTLPAHTPYSSQETRLRHFQCLPDLFDIHQPFMMDSQFDKLKKSTTTESHREDTESIAGLARRKKRVGLCTWMNEREIPCMAMQYLVLYGYGRLSIWFVTLCVCDALFHILNPLGYTFDGRW